ncbi:MAG: GNAT family N-acetyltransferase [Pseudomonadota bacterium]
MSEPSYSLRAATMDDVLKLPAIELAAGKLFPAERIPDPDAHLPIAELERACRSGGLFVAVLAASAPVGDGADPIHGAAPVDAGPDQPVGFAVCEESAVTLHLLELSVHPDHGRRGLGRRLVTRVVEEAAARGLEAVTLTTFADIPWNAPFYAAMGFEVLSEQDLTAFLAGALEEERALGLTERVARVILRGGP